MIKIGSQHLDALKDGRQIVKARHRQRLRFAAYQTKFSHLLGLACAAAVIRWGPNASSDRLRVSAHCTSCGTKGATIQRPGRAGTHISFEPFPTNGIDVVIGE